MRRNPSSRRRSSQSPASRRFWKTPPASATTPSPVVARTRRRARRSPAPPGWRAGGRRRGLPGHPASTSSRTPREQRRNTHDRRPGTGFAAALLDMRGRRQQRHPGDRSRVSIERIRIGRFAQPLRISSSSIAAWDLVADRETHAGQRRDRVEEPAAARGERGVGAGLHLPHERPNRFFVGRLLRSAGGGAQQPDRALEAVGAERGQRPAQRRAPGPADGQRASGQRQLLQVRDPAIARQVGTPAPPHPTARRGPRYPRPSRLTPITGSSRPASTIAAATWA